MTQAELEEFLLRPDPPAGRGAARRAVQPAQRSPDRRRAGRRPHRLRRGARPHHRGHRPAAAARPGPGRRRPAGPDGAAARHGGHRVRPGAARPHPRRAGVDPPRRAGRPGAGRAGAARERGAVPPPGHPRPAHRPAQPGAVHRAAAAASSTRPGPAGRRLGRLLRRPRRLQGGQRHARATTSATSCWCSVAERLRRGRRTSHLVARMGGDEFVILVDGHDLHRRRAQGGRRGAGRDRRAVHRRRARADRLGEHRHRRAAGRRQPRRAT